MINGGKISALAWSLAVHAVIAAGFVVTVRYTVPVQPQQPAGQVIEAVAIDAAALRAREHEKAEAARRAEEARQAELRRQREAAAAEQRRREDQARQAELERQQEIRRQQEAEAKRVEAERQRQAEARRKAEAEAEARRKAEAERQRREAEAQARAERESELQRSLEAEADRLAAIESGKQAEWVGAIRNKMERILVLPPGTRDNFYCEAELRQIPGGEVVQVKIGKCDNELLARAVETAAWKASPLPRPPDPSLFDSYVTVIFAPEEK